MSELRQDLQAATLQWHNNGTPVSAEFEDIYFSTDDGLAESQYVFLQQNQLQQRWRAPVESFSIGETGFGSGLNFLLTRELWEQLQPGASRLHYISVEKHPMRRADLQRALKLFPSLHQYVDELIAQYPPIVSGHHVLHFRRHSITLHLLFGDGASMLRQLLVTDASGFEQPPAASVDAWYLDGFAPRTNPALWSLKLCSIISRLSKHGTTLSTFSAAASVKENLLAAGFNVHKTAGFGRKRDMLTAVWQHPPAMPTATQPRTMYDFPRALWYVNANGRNRGTTVAVIGGGIAGCCGALSLARRGLRVQLLEQGPELAVQASGNAQVALYARLSPFTSPLNDFSLAAYFFALRYYQEYFPHGGQQCGLLQLLTTVDEHKAYTALLQQCNDNALMRYYDRGRASATAGIDIAKSAVFFPQAGWLRPQSLCARLVDHPNIQVRLNTAMRELTQEAGCWRLADATGQPVAETENVVIAMGPRSNALPATAFLPLKAIRGQVSYVAATKTSAELRSVVCERSFIMPALDGLHTVGASYNLTATHTELSEQEHDNNMRQLAALLPAAITAAAPTPLQGRVGFRCVAPDYLPVVGPVPDPAAFRRDYAALAKDAKQTISRVAQPLPGLYISSAYGSRAYCLAPLCAELLASHITGETAPLPAYVTRALLPGRFIMRKIIRGS